MFTFVFSLVVILLNLTKLQSGFDAFVHDVFLWLPVVADLTSLKMGRTLLLFGCSLRAAWMFHFFWLAVTPSRILYATFYCFYPGRHLKGQRMIEYKYYGTVHLYRKLRIMV